MKTIIPDVSIRSIASWLPSNKISLSSFAEQYGEKETRDGVKNFMTELIGKNIYTTDKFLSKNELAQNNIKRYIS